MPTVVAETAAGEIELPAIAGQPLAGDDAAGVEAPKPYANAERVEIPVGLGLRIVWDRTEPLRSRQAQLFRFRLIHDSGLPARDVELYMGMLGYAAFVSEDRSVFAHVHPFGSVAMPSLQLAQQTQDHAGHGMAQEGVLPSENSFPYGFPQTRPVSASSFR